MSPALTCTESFRSLYLQPTALFSICLAACRLASQGSAHVSDAAGFHVVISLLGRVRVWCSVPLEEELQPLHQGGRGLSPRAGTGQWKRPVKTPVCRPWHGHPTRSHKSCTVYHGGFQRSLGAKALCQCTAFSSAVYFHALGSICCKPICFPGSLY